MSSSQELAQSVSAADVPSAPMQVKGATLTLKLRSDSGYNSDEQCRVSADQWSRIQAILYERGEGAQ